LEGVRRVNFPENPGYNLLEKEVKTGERVANWAAG
jgi:hypothetical protein